MKFIKRYMFIFVFLILLASCEEKEQSDRTKPIIYTSIYPLEFIVEQLTESFAITETVFPPGVDAHTYEPTLKDILAIADGRAFFFFGKNMEGSAHKIAEALNDHDVALIEIGTHTNLFLHEQHDDSYSHGDYDPHIWFDPERMILLSEIIKDELQQRFRNHQEAIEQNFQQLTAELKSLDEQYTRRLQHKTQRQIIVSHAAYSYWEDKYGIEQLPISGISSTEEPSQKSLAHLIELALENKLEYVLFEKTASNKLAKIVQEEIGAKVLYIHNLETLLQEDIDAGHDYISIMQNNLNVLDEATQ